MEEMADFVVLWDLVESVQLTTNEDQISWRWTTDGEYKIHCKISIRSSVQGILLLLQAQCTMASTCWGQAQIFRMVIGARETVNRGQTYSTELALQSNLPLVSSSIGDCRASVPALPVCDAGLRTGQNVDRWCYQHPTTRRVNWRLLVWHISTAL